MLLLAIGMRNTVVSRDGGGDSLICSDGGGVMLLFLAMVEE